jgi:hypothetical protein
MVSAVTTDGRVWTIRVSSGAAQVGITRLELAFNLASVKQRVFATMEVSIQHRFTVFTIANL